MKNHWSFIELGNKVSLGADTTISATFCLSLGHCAGAKEYGQALTTYRDIGDKNE